MKTTLCTLLLLFCIGCNSIKYSNKPMTGDVKPSDPDYVAPGTRLILPVVGADGKQRPSYEDVAGYAPGCKVTNVTRHIKDKDVPAYLIDCRKNGGS